MRKRTTSRTVRLYALSLALIVFFVLISTVAARTSKPKASPMQDPRLTALEQRQRRLRLEAAHVQAVIDKRWAVYRARLTARLAEIAAAEQRHRAEVVAAQEVAARLAALQRAGAPASPHNPPGAPARRTQPAPTSPLPAAEPQPAAPTPAPTVRVVTLPPQVEVVSVPPVTTSTSS